MIFFCRDYGDDMKKNFFKNQTLLLVFSILIGFATIILGVGYAFYVFDINISDLNSLNTVKSMKVDLDINPISGSLKLCQSYPITVSEGLNCEPYIFYIQNNNNVDLTMYLNLELYNTSTLPSTDIHIAFVECKDSSCSNNDYTHNTLDGTVKNLDVAHEGTTGYLLSTESSFKKNDIKYYKIIIWQNEESTLQNQTFKASIGAVSYTKANSNLTYNVYYAFNDALSFGAESCNTLKGYESIGNYCKKSYNILSKITDVPNNSIEYYKGEWTSNYNKKIEVGTSKYDLYKDIYVNINQVPEFDFTCSFTSEVGTDDQLYLKANNNPPENFENVLSYYGWSSTYDGEKSTSRLLELGTYTYYIKDKYNSKNSCSIDIVKSTTSKKDDCEAPYTCPSGKDAGKVHCCHSGKYVGGSCGCNKGSHTVYNCDDGYSLCNNSNKGYCCKQ